MESPQIEHEGWFPNGERATHTDSYTNLLSLFVWCGVVKTLVVCQSVTALISPCTQADRADVLQHAPIHRSHDVPICPSNQAVQSECTGATLTTAHTVLTEFKFELVSAVSHSPVLPLSYLVVT